MQILNIVALLVTIAAVFSYINHRVIRLPTTIGLMSLSLVISLALIAIGELGYLNAKQEAERFLAGIDFNVALLHGMLSFLLFAGALHVNLSDLARQKWVIGVLATFGVLMSTLLVGTASWYVLAWLGMPLPYLYCLLFGALISPTDPVAVIGMLKSAGVKKSLETKIAGESLFNDGVGVVVFLVLLGIVAGGGDITPGSVLLLFVEETFGGILFGLLIGWLAYSMLRSVNNYQVEVLITLALVMGGYALAMAIHVSGPG
jgi:CPA1 family monovalent cation:H+ antiporter